MFYGRTVHNGVCHNIASSIHCICIVLYFQAESAISFCSKPQAHPGRIIFSSGSGRVLAKFSLFFTSKVSFSHNLMGVIRGEIVLCILK